MLRGIYAAASGMDAATDAHTTISRNLAHSAVPGFRRSVVPFSSLEALAQGKFPGESQWETVGTRSHLPETDFTQGVLSQTGNPLDVALSGDGFFTVQGPEGPLYTRNGTFTLDARQQLVTAEGLPVLGAGGPIQMPADVPLSRLTIGPDGTIRHGTTEVGKLEIARFDNSRRLISVGATLFQAPSDTPPQPSTAQVTQGSRELSNVSPMSELVGLITAQRHYEASQKTLTALDRVMQRRLESN